MPISNTLEENGVYKGVVGVNVWVIEVREVLGIDVGYVCVIVIANTLVPKQYFEKNINSFLVLQHTHI